MIELKKAVNGNQNKEIRGRILKILYMNYPQPTGDHLISEILTDIQYSISPAKVNGLITYLAEKKYVIQDTAEIPEYDISRNLVKLTSKGIDLIEGNIDPDPGVIL